MLSSRCRPLKNPSRLAKADALRMGPKAQIRNRGAAAAEATDQ